MEIRRENNSMLVRCSDNPPNLDSVIEKLSQKLEKQRIYKPALNKDDIIFTCIIENEFRNKLNMFHGRT